MSASGTKRTCRGVPSDVRFRGQTGHQLGHGFMSASDPKRTWAVLSDAVDARSIAPRCGEMDVQVLCFHIRELALYRRFDVSAFDDLPACHHPRSIKAAHGEHAFAKLLRHLANGIECFLAAANVDGKSHTVWR